MNNTLKVIALVSLLMSSAGYAQDIPDDVTVIPDDVTAVRNVRPFAEQGNAFAQTFLGMWYAEGKGVAQDYKESVKWYRLAAEQGHASAQYGLGLMYAEGKGVAQDYKESLKWHQLAAEQGDADAGSTPIPRTVIKRLITLNHSSQLVDAYADCENAQCSQICPLWLYPSCDKSSGSYALV